MPDKPTLIPAQELAATNKIHFPNESAEYRQARNALLIEEIELRRHLERIHRQTGERFVSTLGQAPGFFWH